MRLFSRRRSEPVTETANAIAFKQLLFDETLKSGSLRSLLVFLGLLMILLSVTLSRFFESPENELNAVVWGREIRVWVQYLLVGVLLYELLIWWILKYQSLTQAVMPLLYLLAFFEMSTVTSLLWFIAQVKTPDYTLATPPMLFYSVITISFALFLNIWLCLFAGIIAAIQYLDFAVYLSSLSMSGGSGEIHFHDLVKSMILFFTGVTGAFIAGDIQRRIANSFHHINALSEEKARSQSILTNNIKQQAEQLERKVAERTHELKQANETKDKFFSIIAHDLRGPVGGIAVIFNEMVLTPEDLDEGLLASIRKTSQSTYDLLENLLVWARAQRNQIDWSPQQVCLADALNRSADLLHNALVQKNIALQLDVDEQLYVYADRAMLLTIIRNLLNNAIKFTGRGGRIVVGVETQAMWVKIGVQDTGVGMSEQTLNKLFRLGESASTRGTEKEEGSGLGLLLCKDFVEKNHGKIGVDSRMGQGSCFWFTLPLGTQPEPGQNARGLDQALMGLKVLLAEDNVLHEQTSVKILTDYKMDICVVRTGQEAMDAAAAQHFDLIFMDIDLPDVDGITVLQWMHNRLTPMPTVIALSSYDKTEIEARTDGVVFDGYLNKPMCREDLREVLS